MDDMTMEGYIGECGTVGSHFNDHRTQVNFKAVTGIAVSEESVFVSSYADKLVLAMNRETEMCSIRVKFDTGIFHLIYEYLTNTLYIAMMDGIAFKTLSDQSEVPSILIKNYGSGIGSFASTGFDHTRDMIMLDAEHLLVQDRDNNR